MVIEPGLRFVTVRRIVVLILLLGPLGVYEWRFGQNLYGVIGQKIFQLGTVHADVQIRSGRGRMAVCFNDSELAGIVFGMTAALNTWLVYLNKRRLGDNLGKLLGRLEKYHIPGLLLLLYILLTQSRGPLLAMIVAYPILLIPRFKSRKTVSVVVAILIGIAAVAATRYYSQYTNISDPGAVVSEQQGSALYRRQMNELYQPIVQAGGLLGWGMLNHPSLPGMFSIDNEFLLIHIAYGSLGFVIFGLVAAETFRRLIVRSWTMRADEDQAFAFVLLGAMTVFWISITTVYMGEQIPQIAFLLIGWGQSIVPGSTTQITAQEEKAGSKFSFRRVFT
jgi:hypothetical protein